LEELKKELPDFAARQRQQAVLADRYELIRKYLRPGMSLENLRMFKVTEDWVGGWGPVWTTAGFASDLGADLSPNPRNIDVSNSYAYGRNPSEMKDTQGRASRGLHAQDIQLVTPATRNIWAKNALWEIMRQDYGIETDRQNNLQSRANAIKQDLHGQTGTMAGQQKKLADLQWELKRKQDIKDNRDDISRRRINPTIPH